MPSRTTDRQESQKLRAERARRFLTGGGVTREDSDDELGLEDYPWEWLYERGETSRTREIIGARMGGFQCKLGDCVLLKAEGSNEAWVGLIVSFQEDEEEDEKMADFMWFSTEKEIRNKQKKRMDALPVCARPAQGSGTQYLNIVE